MKVECCKKVLWPFIAFLALGWSLGCKSDEKQGNQDSGGTLQSDAGVDSALDLQNDSTILADYRIGDSIIGDAQAKDSTSQQGDAKSSDTAPNALVNLDGVVEDINGKAMADVSVSVLGASPSITSKTGSNGGYDLQVNAGSTVFLIAEKTGYMSMIRGLVVPAKGATDFNLWLMTPTAIKDWVNGTSLGTFDLKKGLVYMEFDPKSNGGGEGAKLSQPNAGSMTETSGEEMQVSDKLLANGKEYLLFLNVEPGKTNVTNIVAPSGWTCKLDNPNLANIPILAHGITHIDFGCAKN